MQLSKKHLRLLTLSAIILLSLNWLSYGMSALFALIPILIIEKHYFENPKTHRIGHFFWRMYLIMLVWHTALVWWLTHASLPATILGIILFSAFPAAVITLGHWAKRRTGRKSGYFALLIFWLAFEQIHIFWELSWPWMNLGNWFARNIWLIQWYEFTGIRGGSLWILLVNFFLFMMIEARLDSRFTYQYRKNMLAAIIFLFVPIITSLTIFFSYQETENPYDIVVVQPNVDPYHDKYDSAQRKAQLADLIALSDSLADADVDYFVGPETAFPQGIWENSLSSNFYINSIRAFINKYPGASYVVGLSSYKMYPKSGTLPSPTARPYSVEDSLFYDRYNTVIQIDTTNNIPIYHKSKFVLGVEKMPFLSYLQVIEEFALDLGGIVGSLGYDTLRTNFISARDGNSVAPVICFESVYGQFISEFVQQGADMIFVVTNDGWWKNTQGHRQHLTMSQVRAIENRRSIARSANTGISCFIDQRGKVHQPTEYWVRDVIRGKINANNKITIYTKYGDIIGRIAIFMAVLVLIYTFVQSKLRK